MTFWTFYPRKQTTAFEHVVVVLFIKKGVEVEGKQGKTAEHLNLNKLSLDG